MDKTSKKTCADCANLGKANCCMQCIRLGKGHKDFFMDSAPIKHFYAFKKAYAG